MSTLLFAIALTTATTEVELGTIDGATVSGAIVDLTAERVTIETPDGRRTFQTDSLMRLAPRAEPRPSAPTPAVRVGLVDGCSLVAQQYTVHGDRAQITLTGDEVLELPRNLVRHVRLQVQTEVVAQEWERILSMDTDSDLLVVRQGETVDYHRGVLRDVTDAAVRFELDGEVLPIKRAKVHGLVYCHGAGITLPEPICRIFEAGGSRWSVGSIALAGDLQWTTPAGLTVSRPWDAIAQVDFSRGKVLFLSDLKPESLAFTPFFGSPNDVPVLAKFFAPREDVSLESRPLALDGKRYSKGLALHCRTELVYRLPGRFRWFRAIAGIDDAVRPQGHVCLVVRGDDRALLECTITGTDPPRPIELDLTGVRRLTLLVDFGDQLDVGDHLDLCEARIIK